MPTVVAFFAGHPDAQRLFDAVQAAMDEIGAAEISVTKSQVSFRRRIAFAWVWRPGQYRRGRNAPLVLSIGLRRRDASPRWKEVVEPTAGRFMHHLELFVPDAIDAEVIAWLHEAWDAAG